MCGVYFSNGELYKGHINKYHQQLLVTCKFCNEVVFSPEISHHIITTHTTCFSCLKSFASEELLQAHVMECTAPVSQVSSVTVPVQPDNPAPTEDPEPAPSPEPEPPVAEPTPQASGLDQPPAPGSKSPGRTSRPHACEYCEKRFAKVSSLHMHISQAHKDKVDPGLLNTRLIVTYVTDNLPAMWTWNNTRMMLTRHQHQFQLYPLPHPHPPAPHIIIIVLSAIVNILVTLRKMCTGTKEADISVITFIGVTNVNLFQTMLMI